jgi:hypothetical protein
MNEPTNPSEPTPPPPPPPPFSPPPAPTKTTPPPGPPAKKSAMPWVLGGCGCLTLIIIICVVIAMLSYRAKQRITDFKSDFKSALKSIDEKESKSPKEGWITYTNVKGNLPAKLQTNFVAFSFEYPKTFQLQPASQINFVKVEKAGGNNNDSTAENFAVGSAWFEPPNVQNDALYDKLLDQLGQQLSGTFHNYTETTRVPVTVDGVQSRAVLFRADFKELPSIKIFGKVIVVHPPGKRNGVSILILGTSYSHDIKSPDDAGSAGDTGEILRSFKFL